MKSELILCFGYSRWGEWRQDQEVAFRLARHNTVVYVEPQRPRSENGQSPAPALRWLNDRLAVLRTPPRLPFCGTVSSRTARRALARPAIMLSKQRLLAAVESALRGIDRRPTLSLFFDAFDLPLAGKLGEEVAAYRVCDEVSLLPSLQPIREVIEEIELDALPGLDLIFASSRSQSDRRMGVNGNTHFVPNGCDFERFNRALTSDWPLPDDLAPIPPPRIGFVGAVDSRVDYGLLRFLARSRRDWSIVVIGAVSGEVASRAAELRALPDLHLLGDKRPEAVPMYLRHLQASMIPYRITERTVTMLPCEVHEHLAAGKPVVATALPELRPLADVVAIAESPVEFVERLDDALEDESEEKLLARVRAARANSWDQRVETMSGLIDEVLKSRRRRGRSSPTPIYQETSGIAAVHCW